MWNKFGVPTIGVDSDSYQEQIRKAVEDHDRLQAAIADISLDRLEAICNAEREGRCVVLTCKVGDTVYARKYSLSEKAYIIVPCIVAAIKIFREGNYHIESVVNGGVMKMELGRQVFLTREAAEAALEEVQE